MVQRIAVPSDRYLLQLCKSLAEGGVLLVSLDENRRPNAMTIGWGQLGIIWGKWICTVLVRPSRYTYGCCNATGDFTVNVPYPSQAALASFCGTQSGRDYDKFAECRITAVPARCGEIASPYIGECGLAYECRTVHFNEVIPAHLSKDVAASAYPEGNYHRVYFGEVLAAHAHEDFEERFARGG